MGKKYATLHLVDLEMCFFAFLWVLNVPSFARWLNISRWLLLYFSWLVFALCKEWLTRTEKCCLDPSAPAVMICCTVSPLGPVSYHGALSCSTVQWETGGQLLIALQEPLGCGACLSFKPHTPPDCRSVHLCSILTSFISYLPFCLWILSVQKPSMTKLTNSRSVLSLVCCLLSPPFALLCAR